MTVETATLSHVAILAVRELLSNPDYSNDWLQEFAEDAGVASFNGEELDAINESVERILAMLMEDLPQQGE